MIPPPLRDRLWPFLGAIARRNEITVLAIGGMPDHVHLFPFLPPSQLPKALQLIKGGSSKWMHETFLEHWSFRFQVRYDAFGVSCRCWARPLNTLTATSSRGRFDLIPFAKDLGLKTGLVFVLPRCIDVCKNAG